MKTIVLIALSCAFASAQTVLFPSAVDTDAQLKVAANLVTTTLISPVAPTDNVLVVKSSLGFSANQLVTIDGEIMSICSALGNILTVGSSSCPNLDGRGFDSTTAAAHLVNANVNANIDAYHHNVMRKAVEAVENFTLNGGAFPGTAYFTFPHANLTQYNWVGAHYDIGGYNTNAINGVSPIVGTFLGSGPYPTGSNAGAGLAGFSLNTYPGANGWPAVGVFGLGTCGATTSQCWGANLSVNHNGSSILGSTMVGLETDVNHSEAIGSAASAIIGQMIVSNLLTAPSGYSYGLQIRLNGANSSLAFTNGIEIGAGAATVGLQLNQQALSGVSNSQPIDLHSAKTNGAGGVLGSDGVIFQGSDGTLVLRGDPAGLGVSLDPMANSNYTVTAAPSGGILIRNGTLPACNGTTRFTLFTVTGSPKDAVWMCLIGSSGVLAWQQIF